VRVWAYRAAAVAGRIRRFAAALGLTRHAALHGPRHDVLALLHVAAGEAEAPGEAEPDPGDRSAAPAVETDGQAQRLVGLHAPETDEPDPDRGLVRREEAGRGRRGHQDGDERLEEEGAAEPDRNVERPEGEPERQRVEQPE